jgi:hypothetical protein
MKLNLSTLKIHITTLNSFLWIVVTKTTVAATISGNQTPSLLLCQVQKKRANQKAFCHTVMLE